MASKKSSSSKPKKSASRKSNKKSESKKAGKNSAASGDGRATKQAAEEVALGGNEEPEEKPAKKKQKTSVEFESPIQREEAVAYFETLVAGLKRGNIHLKQDGEELSLTPPSQLEVKVKASRKKDKEKISFQMTWRTAAASELMISSK